MIKIDNKAVIDRVLAQAALRHLLNKSRPPALTRDNTAALELLIDSSFSALCLGLIPYVSHSRRLKDDHAYELELTTLPGRQEAEARLMAEEAIAAYVLCLAFEGVDQEMVAQCRSEFADKVSLCRHICGGSALTPLSAAWL